MDPHIFDVHRELTADAAEGASIQLAMMARFIRQGECAAAVTTYSRVKPIIKEFLHPGMQVIEAAAADALTSQAAEEWRRDRPVRRRQTDLGPSSRVSSQVATKLQEALA